MSEGSPIVFDYAAIARAMPSVQRLGACLAGACACAVAEHCRFRRCRNCDMPVEVNGRAFERGLIELVVPSLRSKDDCPECGGPIPCP